MLSLISVLLIAVGLIGVIAVTYESIFLYIGKKTSLTFNLLLSQVVDNFRMYIETTILLYITFIMFAIPILSIAFYMASYPMVALISVACVLLLMVYIAIPASMIFIIRVIENVSFFKAFIRCFQLLKGYWWSTFFLYTITLLIIFSLTALPFFIVSIAAGTISWLALNTLIPSIIFIVQVFCSLFYMFGHAFLLVVVALRYFTLAEIGNGGKLIDKINSIGIPLDQQMKVTFFADKEKQRIIRNLQKD